MQCEGCGQKFCMAHLSEHELSIFLCSECARACVNCGMAIVGDGRMYPGSNVLPKQPQGRVCDACESSLIAENNSELYRLHEVSK